MAVKIISLLLFLSIVIPFGVFYMGKRTKKRGRTALLTNVIAFFAVLLCSTILMFGNALAAPADTAGGGDLTAGLGFLAAALVTGLSTIGAGIAVAASASTALGAISEDPNLMGKSLIFVALAEGIALYGLLVSFSILGRI